MASPEHAPLLSIITSGPLLPANTPATDTERGADAITKQKIKPSSTLPTGDTCASKETSKLQFATITQHVAWDSDIRRTTTVDSMSSCDSSSDDAEFALTLQHPYIARPQVLDDMSPTENISYDASDRRIGSQMPFDWTRREGDRYLSPPTVESMCRTAPYRHLNTSSSSLAMLERTTSLPETSHCATLQQKQRLDHADRKFHFREHRHTPYWWLPQPKQDLSCKESIRQLRCALGRQRRQIINTARPEEMTGGLSKPWSLPGISRRHSAHELRWPRPRWLVVRDADEAMSLRARSASVNLPPSPPRMPLFTIRDAICQRLMAHQVPSPPVEIQLRRPSSLSGAGQSDSCESVAANERESVYTNPIPVTDTDTTDRNSLTTYLLSSKEIQDIMAMIEACLGNESSHVKTAPRSRNIKRRPTNTGRGFTGNTRDSM